MSALARWLLALVLLATTALACSSDSPHAPTEPDDLASDAGTDDAAGTGTEDAASDLGDDEPDRPTDLFDLDHLTKVEITLPAEDWDQLRHQTRGLIETLGGECLAQPFGSPYTWFEGSVTLDGQTFPRVDVRKKGFLGSASEDRPGLKLDLGEYDRGQTFLGARRLTFNNAVSDPSVVRQCLTYSLFARAGRPAPRCAFAQVEVNGQDLGLYVNVEPVKSPFLERHFGSSAGNLYEGTLSDFTPEASGTFEAKNNESVRVRTDIDRVITALEANDDELIDALSSVIDLEGFVTFWALEVLALHTDGYAGNTNNFYLYRDPASGLFQFIPWGADETLGSEGSDAPEHQSVLTRGVLANRLYRHPVGRQLYLDALTSLLDTVWDEAALDADLTRMQEVLAPALDADDREALIDEIDAVRDVVEGRRRRIQRELDGAPLDVGPSSPIPWCLKTVGEASAAFETSWGTLEREDWSVNAGTTLEIEIDGEPATFESVLAAAGQGDDGPQILLLGVVGEDQFLLVAIGPEQGVFSEGSFDLDEGGGHLAYAIWFDNSSGEEAEIVGFIGGELTLSEVSQREGAAVRGALRGGVYNFGWQ